MITAEATPVGKNTLEATGMILTMKIANRGITEEVPSPHSLRNLNQLLEMAIPAKQKATLITNLQQRISPARASLKVAAVAVKRRLTAVEAKVAVKESPEITEKVHLMRYHNLNQEPRIACQIITPH